MTPLTARQRDVAKLVAEGLTDKRIAAQLGIEHNTVRVHVVAIAYALGIEADQTHTRVMIAKWWIRAHPEAA